MFSLVYHKLVAEDVVGFNSDVRKRLAEAIQERLTSHPESYGKPLRGSLTRMDTWGLGELFLRHSAAQALIAHPTAQCVGRYQEFVRNTRGGLVRRQ